MHIFFNTTVGDREWTERHQWQSANSVRKFSQQLSQRLGEYTAIVEPKFNKSCSLFNWMVVHLSTSPNTVSRWPARNISVPLSEIYCTYHVTDSTRTAAGLLPLLVRPPGTVSTILYATRSCFRPVARHFVCMVLAQWGTEHIREVHSWYAIQIDVLTLLFLYAWPLCHWNDRILFFCSFFIFVLFPSYVNGRSQTLQNIK